LHLGERLTLRVLPLIEALNRRCSKVGVGPFFDPALFPWVGGIARDWRAIRAELEPILERRTDLPGFHDILPEIGLISGDRGWKSFMLTGMGHVAQRNAARCPQTWRLVQQIPGLTCAMFSILEPGKHLRPHRGPYNGVLRFHLGLIVPVTNETVAIRVGEQTRHWNEGEPLILDDAFEHEAWNRSDEVRVVLFVDFARPLRFPANLVNRLVLALAARSPFVLEAYENTRRWERAFGGSDG